MTDYGYEKNERCGGPEGKLQDEAKKAVAKKFGVKLCEVGTDVESFPGEPPFVLWSIREGTPQRRFGHYENGIVVDTTDMARKQKRS